MVLKSDGLGSFFLRHFTNTTQDSSINNSEIWLLKVILNSKTYAASIDYRNAKGFNKSKKTCKITQKSKRS